MHPARRTQISHAVRACIGERTTRAQPRPSARARAATARAFPSLSTATRCHSLPLADLSRPQFTHTRDHTPPRRRRGLTRARARTRSAGHERARVAHACGARRAAVMARLDLCAAGGARRAAVRRSLLAAQSSLGATTLSHSNACVTAWRRVHDVVCPPCGTAGARRSERPRRVL